MEVKGGGGVFIKNRQKSFHIFYTFYAISNISIKFSGGGGGGLSRIKTLISCFFVFLCYFPTFLELNKFLGWGCFYQKRGVSF